MNTSPVVPNVSSDSDDVLSVIPSLDKNYADAPEVLEFFRSSILPATTATRSDRKTLEEEWNAVRNMALQRHDDSRRYLGRSDAYLPVYARARTTFVSQLARGLFPSDEYMDVIPVDERTTPEEAQANKQLLRHEFERGMRLRTAMKPFLRQFVDFGVSVGKVLYAKEEVNRKKLQLGRLMAPEYAAESYKEGCRFYTRNVFHWYIYPSTAASLAEAQMVFEDILVPTSIFKEKKLSGAWKNVEQAIEADADIQQQVQEMLDAHADHPSPVGTPSTGDYGVRAVTEIWTMMPMPRSAYSRDEIPGTPIPVKLVVSGTAVLEARRNPFWHQCPPYVVARDEWEVGSFYPRGQGHRVKHLQVLVNDFANQTNDNGTYSLNPIVLANPSLLTAPLGPLKPGGVYQGSDVNQMLKFDRPPIEQLNSGLQLVNTFAGMLVDYMGTPPIIQGVGAGKAGKTATQSQILQRNAMNPLQDIVEDIEIDVLQQVMEMAYSLNQQFRSAESMRAIGGMSATKFDREALAGRYAFYWMASSQAVNQQQRAQGIMQLLQIMGPMIPVLQANGYGFNPVPWLKRLATDGFGLRQFDEVVTKMQPQMGPPGMGGPPPSPPGMGPGDRVRSAVEQGGGEPGMEMAPGEGDDFMDVRGQADALAAMLGGMGGGEE